MLQIIEMCHKVSSNFIEMFQIMETIETITITLKHSY